ncbi:MAG: aminodeoxychorismate synthase component [Caulobacteraceae bacterium]|nr:aminodeoxychorismate synthase component [Caulobacteraceae bacterium]
MTLPVMIERSWREPAEVLSAFADEPFACALTTGGDEGWSYVLRRPAERLVIDRGQAGKPFEALRALLGPPAARDPAGPPFQGGVIALCAYELAARIEALDLTRADAWPDLAAARYPELLAFDRQNKRLLAIGRDRAGAEWAASWLDAAAVAPEAGDLADSFQPRTSPQAYEAVVETVRERIVAGDIFQANLAQAWSGKLAPGRTPFDLFSRLQSASPAPFSAYLRLNGLALVSNSPERFIRLQDGEATTQPIKGTRPRAVDPAADAAAAAELAASDKDRAENLMIVDLMRNDLARVCQPGTVQVGALYALQSFANVHHLVSTVRGQLEDRYDAFDLIEAAFPPGSITGAPKIQAMKLISALEPPRGPYCGALIWAGFDGDMDSSVLIRTVGLVESEDGWCFEARAGAGITALSDPAAEQAETCDKIAALAAALGGASHD